METPLKMLFLASKFLIAQMKQLMTIETHTTSIDEDAGV